MSMAGHGRSRSQESVGSQQVADTMMLFIERDIAVTISMNSIIYDFEDLKKQQVSFS